MAESDLVLEAARFVQRISAIAKTGLAFKPDGYDSERYEELLREAARMSARLGEAGDDEARSLAHRWRAEVINGYAGYVTPRVGCGAIAFNGGGELLMMRRPNNRWWYPTGFCEVGLSPAENVVKEVREETGLIARPIRLMAVIDSIKLGSPESQIYSLLFYCAIDGGELKPNPLEALEVGFFPIDALPRPFHGRDQRWVELARQFHFEERRDPLFDPA
jgi:ADP-ribose pyrophosphatase YjhB (NUDIX family)